MLKVGLTGGIASGKSTVAWWLVEKGAIHIDFDALAHFVEEPDQPAWKAIVASFGRGILNDDRTISREKLGAIVFQDREKLKLLNGLVHPAVYAEWHCRLEEIGRQKPEAIVLAGVPLLFEENLQSLFDLVVLVYIPPEEQLRRLVARNGYGEEEARRRLAAQMPIADKIPLADLVVNNGGREDETRELVDRLWQDLLEREEHKRMKQEVIKQL